MAGGVNNPYSGPDSYTGPDSGGGQTVRDVEDKLNPINVNQQNTDLQEAFEMSVFNMASTMYSQGNNFMQQSFAESNRQEQRRKMVMGMIKQGLT